MATEFDGPGVLLGTQQHLKWRMETSHRSGLKTIEVSPGIDYVFPFSTRADGGAGGADRVEALPPAGVVEVAPTVEPLPQDPLSLGGARVIPGGRPGLGDDDVPYVEPEDRSPLPLLPLLTLLQKAIAERDPALLETYGDGLALIEPAFTLAGAGVGRIYACRSLRRMDETLSRRGQCERRCKAIQSQHTAFKSCSGGSATGR